MTPAPPPPTGGPDDDAPADDAWAGERVARWLRQSAGLERQLAPVSTVLFAAADLQPGERVLDVGCGAGPTTRTAAEAVGSTGAVTGLDVSADMVAAAASLADEGGAPTDWVVADVVGWTPPPPTYDAVISRFGVMFFSDPVTAFTHLAGATRSGGRLAMAVWARRDESDLFAVPLHAVLGVRRAHGLADPDDLPDDGGPFSLGDLAVTRSLLEASGWGGVAATTHDLDLPFAGGLAPDVAAAAAGDFGPTRTALDGLDDAVRDEALAAVAEAFATHVDDAGEVVLGGRVHVVTATRR